MSLYVLFYRITRRTFSNEVSFVALQRQILTVWQKVMLFLDHAKLPLYANYDHFVSTVDIQNNIRQSSSIRQNWETLPYSYLSLEKWVAQLKKKCLYERFNTNIIPFKISLLKTVFYAACIVVLLQNQIPLHFQGFRLNYATCLHEYLKISQVL